jgi:nicotinate phosphoribosyltransferase
MKLSEGKPSLPGRKQVWRGPDFDALGLAGEDNDGEPLLAPALSNGRRLFAEPLKESRARARAQREALPARSRSLAAEPRGVRLTPGLERLRSSLAEP